MTDSEFYYQSVLEIITDYLGPAAQRFLDRQINSYLNKPPQDLDKADLPMLALRIRSGLVVLTHDEDVVEECFRRISSVGDKHHRNTVTA